MARQGECIMWSLYKNTDKGWQIEGTYNSKKESEYYLEEWQEEFPSLLLR